MKQKDTLFAEPMETSLFKFNAQVADVFDNMIQRSVPGYDFLLEVIAVLAQRRNQTLPPHRII